MRKFFTRSCFIPIPVLLMTLLFITSHTETGITQQAFGTVEGTVIEAESNNPLIGTNIVLVGTRFGATTDAEGKYSIPRVPPGVYEVQVSYVGYRSITRDVTVPANQAVTVDFELEIDVLNLDEVVVTGMGGVQIKEKLGISIASVKPTEIQAADEPNIIASLTGKAANVEIVKTSGDAGTASYIRIRGSSSLGLGNQPLFVIDGVPISNRQENRSSGNTENMSRAMDINNEDIESVEVLKGAAAAAIYGSRAANGVVLITTKTGKPGKTKINYKFMYGFNEQTEFWPLQTVWGQGNGGVYVNNYSRSWGPKLDASTPVYDHNEELINWGRTHEQNVTISGGNEMTTFYLSAGRIYEKGIWKSGSEYERYTTRFKGTQVITDKIKITGNISYAKSKGEFVMRADNAIGLGIGALRCPPDFNNLPYLHPETGYHRAYRYHEALVERKSRKFDNPFWIMHEHQNLSEVDRVMASLRGEYDILDWVKAEYTVGTDYSIDDRTRLLPPSTSRDPIGQIRRYDFKYTEMDGNFIVTMQGEKWLSKLSDFLDGTLMVGHNWNVRDYHRLAVYGSDFGVSKGFNQLDNTQALTPAENEWEIHTESFFGQATLDLWEQLYLTAAIRNDGSSTFGQSDPRHWYPKASAAWEFTKASYMPEIPYLNFGKVRFAYGESGSQPSVYSTITGYTTGNQGHWNSYLGPGYMGQAGYWSQSSAGQTNVKPERTKETEFGANLAFMDSRIGLDYTFYHTKSVDVLIRLDQSPASGYSSQLRNAASLKNWGHEITLDFVPVSKPNFHWDMNLIWAQNRSEVLSLAGADRDGSNAPGQEMYNHRGSEFIKFGRGIVYQGVNIDEAYPGTPEGTLYITETGYPVVENYTRWQGLDSTPNWLMSLRNTFTIKRNWTIGAFVDIRGPGGYIRNGTRGVLYLYGTHARTIPRDTETKVFEGVGPGAGKEVALNEWWWRGPGGYFSGGRMQFMEDGWYVKLREISVSYKMRNEFIRNLGLSDVALRLSGRNLHTWTDYQGLDPETSQGGDGMWSDYFNQPQTRSYNFTLRINY